MYKPKSLFTLILILLLSGITSCTSNEPETSGKPELSPEEYLELLSRSEESTTYVMDSWQVFRMHGEETEWTELNLSEWIGLQATAPYEIVFQDNKVWTPVKLTDLAYGPSPFCEPWYGYLRVTSKNDLLYLTTNFNYDKERKEMLIGKRNYTVERCSEDEFVISIISEYAGGEENKGGHHKDVYIYKITSPIDINSDQRHGFANYTEAFRYILDCARGQFGDEIKLTDIFNGPDMWYEGDETINLLDLEQYLQDLIEGKTELPYFQRY